MVKRACLCLAAMLVAVPLIVSGRAHGAFFVAGNLLRDDQPLDRLWQGEAHFEQILQLQIESNGAVAPTVPHPSGMDLGTQIVARAQGPGNGSASAWYLFNREYDFGVPQPANCPSNAPLARIVVRVSYDQGRTWSPLSVVAEPDFERGECELVDGHAFYDDATLTWHYLVQMRSGILTSHEPPESWNINHYRLEGSDPRRHFASDPENPVIRSGQLWKKICASGATCPSDTGDEGTPEISFKQGGSFYVTFHGAAGSPTIRGFRGAAKTQDFHTWITHGDDPHDPRLPAGPLWSAQDCNPWPIAWYPGGCVGGGHASTLLTPRFTYLMIEAPDRSLGCTRGQHWPVGLARTAHLQGPTVVPHFASSGHWQQYRSNPLLSEAGDVACNIQYPRFFVDADHLYLAYWTLGADDHSTFLRVARLISSGDRSSGASARR